MRKSSKKKYKNPTRELRNRRTLAGWEFFSCQVPKPIKKRLQTLQRQLMRKYKGY